MKELCFTSLLIRYGLDKTWSVKYLRKRNEAASSDVTTNETLTYKKYTHVIDCRQIEQKIDGDIAGTAKNISRSIESRSRSRKQMCKIIENRMVRKCDAKYMEFIFMSNSLGLSQEII